MMPRAQIRDLLRAYQRRLLHGDSLPPIAEVARKAGVCRDTVYSAIKGDRLDDRSWWGLNSALEQLQDVIEATPSRLMQLKFTPRGVTLKLGLGAPLFRTRKVSER